MNDDLQNVLIVLSAVLMLVMVNYLANRCPKCNKWHPFRYGLIILDKPCEKMGREWVKCNKCGHEWEKRVKGDFDDGGGGE